MASWLDLVRAEVQASNITETAKRMNCSRSALSQVINQCGPYGTGKASVAKLAEKAIQAFTKVHCPFLTEFHGQATVITGAECRGHADRETPPINNPRELRHWRACQACPHRAKYVHQQAHPSTEIIGEFQ
ncbi:MULTISPECIES: hypothetical protein [Achromobacter]|uniref:hypothetical protein n=1 Tax=Achromobacter TaxID=222 RepID=UPI0011B6C85B|nr:MULTISPECIES: hypothetical protein [Achromobacter]MCH4573119.1 hypothetical protein [Achromobacter xylosoxidans]